MKLEQSFEVDAPLEEVWGALVDVERVAPNLPGASVTGRNDDGSYSGTFTIKIGPTTASYTGRLEMRNIDESSHSATMHAQGSDRRGQGGATATISSRLTPLDARTRVEVVTDYHITGRLARFGRGGMIEDISERLLREFASRLQSSLAGGARREEAEPPTVETPGATAVGAESAPPTEAAAPAPAEPAPVSGPAPEAAEATTTAAPAPGATAPPPPPPARPPHGAPPPPHAAPPPPPGAGSPPPPGAGKPSPSAGVPLSPGAGTPSPGAGTPPPSDSAPPAQGLSLVGGVLLDRIKKNPAPLIGMVGGLVLLRLLFRRR